MAGESLIEAFGTHCTACGEAKAVDDVYCGCGAFRPLGGWSTKAPEPETIESLLSRRLGKRYAFDHVVHKWGGHIEYRAQSATGTPVRFLFYTAATESGFSRAFHTAGRAASQIEDPRVASLLDFGTLSSDAYYIAIKYVEGPTLDELLDRGPLNTERALRLFLELAHGLRSLHEAGQALGLLTPEDVILTHDAGGDETVSIPPASFVVGPLVGRAPRRFAAPEMASENAGPKCDQYSLGFMMVEALTGHGRVEEKSPADDVPRRVERMVRRLVDNDPDARFEDMKPVIAILEDALNLGANTPEPTPPPVPGRLSTVKFEGITEGVSSSTKTPLPTVRYGATPALLDRNDEGTSPPPTMLRDTPAPAPEQPPIRPQSQWQVAQLIPLFVLGTALILSLLAVLSLIDPLGLRTPTPQAVQVAATPPDPRPPITDPEPEPADAEDGTADAEHAAADAEDSEDAQVNATEVVPKKRPLPRPPAPKVAPPEPPAPAATPEPADPEPAADPVPAPDPEPAPAPEPGPPAFDVQGFAGVWRGASRNIPIAFDLRLTEDGKVSGTARLTQGARISGEQLTGKWSRDGVGIEIDVETSSDKPVRYLGVLSGDLGKGVVIEKGKTKGDWEVRY